MAAEYQTTDLILVVKGAGAQAVDRTLGSFLQGFLSAARIIDPKARVKIGPTSKILSGFDYQPYTDEYEQDIAEVSLRFGKASGQPPEASRRRVWIMEAYWEKRLAIPGTIRSLLGEWRLTSYALVKLLERLGFPWQSGRRYDERGNQVDDLNAKRYSFSSYLAYYGIATSIVLGFVFLLELLAPRLLRPLVIQRELALLPAEPLRATVPVLAAWILLSLALSIGPARQAYRARQRAAGGEPLRGMPGLGRWQLALLCLAFLLQPGAYTLLLVGYAVAVLATLLIARQVFWRERPDWYTDTPRQSYVSLKKQFIDWKWNRLALLTQLVHRIFVLWGVPVAVAFLIIIKVVRILDLFGDVGKRIDASASELVNQTFGDVTGYALSPVQAARVQNVIQEEIHSFSELRAEDADSQSEPVVDHIHIFAHSQGTPITYETLVHVLDEDERSRVRNYFTAGSPLNLHNLAGDVLDSVFWHRFPPERYPDSNQGFKWFNFWSFTDPITQFTGLDAYRKDELWVKKDGKLWIRQDGRPKLRYAKASPFSIRTRSTLSRHHGDYWTNVEEVHLPLIKHILRDKGGSWIPEEWASPAIQRNIIERRWHEQQFEPETFAAERSRHRNRVLGSWLLAMSIVALLLALLGPVASRWIEALLHSGSDAVESGLAWIAGMLPGDASDASASLWPRAVSAYGSGVLAMRLVAAILVYGLVKSIWQLASSLEWNRIARTVRQRVSERESAVP